MAKMLRMSIPVDAELKAAFLAACRKNGCSGAEVIRFAMQTVVDASRDPDAFRIQLATDTAEPAPFSTRERMHQTVRRSVAEIFQVAA
ncbi:hypothetical protein Bresa_01030|uniref:Uncharacterized protein n=1 Tax=Brenneria salicis ATCC 15712 = DSM 30166 TaxID=714314 RepID=A0A366HYQ1_9GAMM|nr:hypothetical protein [Brenneria salicis]NMN90918.1 hypothetical protein [Brenneria salicis ATCC 15712 = DSM 30166]RBP57628.1 hypothetical protein DES54_16223 [Brenneria salicis ATCC 15712 = DSM 30166]